MTSDPATRTVALLRSQRHSFMNHLQVISGWLQLNQPDRAQHYLEALAARMAAESETVRRLSSAVGQAVIQLGMEAETYAVSLDWTIKPEVAPFSEDAVGALIQRVQDAMNAVSLQPEGSRRLNVQLGPGEAFSVHNVPLPGEG